MRHRTWTLAITLSLCAPGRALAQPDDVHAQADDQFRLGREALARDDHRLALRLFRMSYALEPGRGKLINIAVCEEKLGQLASAFKHFKEVQDKLPEGDDRAPILKQYLDAVGPKLPYLRIRLAAEAPPGTTVTLDGEPLAPGSLGVEVPIDPGVHVVVATASGATEKRYEVSLSSGEHRAVEVAVQAAMQREPVPEASDRAPDAPAPPRLAWTLGVVALGVGGASLAVGAGTGVAAAIKRQSTLTGCPLGPDNCPSSAQPDIDAYNRLGTASTATFILGGALAATGVVLLASSRRREKAAAAAWIAPILGPGVVGVKGRF